MEDKKTEEYLIKREKYLTNIIALWHYHNPLISYEIIKDIIYTLNSKLPYFEKE